MIENNTKFEYFFFQIKNIYFFKLIRRDRVRRVLKRNPLKNVRTLAKLNPFAVVQKRIALRKHLKLNKPRKAVATKPQTANKPQKK